MLDVKLYISGILSSKVSSSLAKKSVELNKNCYLFVLKVKFQLILSKSWILLLCSFLSVKFPQLFINFDIFFGFLGNFVQVLHPILFMLQDSMSRITENWLLPSANQQYIIILFWARTTTVCKKSCSPWNLLKIIG